MLDTSNYYPFRDGRIAELDEDKLPRHYRVVDPRTGSTVTTGTWAPGQLIEDDGDGPRLVIFTGS